jgi:hypothetical protein
MPLTDSRTDRLRLPRTGGRTRRRLRAAHASFAEATGTVHRPGSSTTAAATAMAGDS